MTLEQDIKELLLSGVYDPQELFKRVYPNHRVHYSRVRSAIHEAKSRS